ncbi:hypothetical protein MRX96_006657 [Rhipicephalus microplus]
MFSFGHSGTSSGSGSCQLLTRKKRRGIIEKRRRDRINTSLTELRRLVPDGIRKTGICQAGESRNSADDSGPSEDAALERCGCIHV